MNDFRQINSALKNILGRYQLNEVYEEQILLKSWPEKMDKKIVNIALPQKLKDGKLTLRTQSSLWQQEIIKNKENLLTMIHQAFPDIKIEKLEIV